MYRDRAAPPVTLVGAFRLVDRDFSKHSVAAAVRRAKAWSGAVPRPEGGAPGSGVAGAIEVVELTLETGWNMAGWVDGTKTLKPAAFAALKEIAKAAGIWFGHDTGDFVERDDGSDVEFATTIGFLSALAQFLAGRASTLVFTQNKVTLTKPPAAIVSTMIETDGAGIAFPYAMWVGRWSAPRGQPPPFDQPPAFANKPIGDGEGARVVFSLASMRSSREKQLPQFGCGGVVLTRKAAAYILALRSLFRYRADDENLMQSLVRLADLAEPFKVSVALPTRVVYGWAGYAAVPVVTETAFAHYDFSAPSTH